MKLRILALAAAALALSAVPVRAQTSSCRADGPRCITVAFRETEMRDVAATFAEFAGVSIVLGEGTGGKVTAEIRNQPWNVALGAILEAHGMGARELAPGLLKVETADRIASRAAVEPLVTRVFRLRYVPAEGVAASLAGVASERGHIAVNAEANALVVTDTEAVIAVMERLIGHSGQ
jgi:type IV pilus assembly protein PilQ